MYTIPAHTIVDPLRAMGIDAFVQQTGGGCATLCIGPRTIDAVGDPRYAVLVGPGSFDWSNPAESTFASSELYIGPDDDGESTPLQARSAAEAVYAVVAVLFDHDLDLVANLVAALDETGQLAELPALLTRTETNPMSPAELAPIDPT